jgi:hypothetical protein
MNPVKKIKFGHHWRCDHHRSGWEYAMGGLSVLSTDTGVLFDGIIDKKFSFGSDPGDCGNNWSPYTEPWVGIFHNPPYIPEWFGKGRSAVDIVATQCWQDSLPHCRGLFTLSNYLREWLQSRVSVPVSALLHPTGAPSMQFSMDRYYNNSERYITHIGWWGRKIHSFYMLPTIKLRKLLLYINSSWMKSVMKYELDIINGEYVKPLDILGYLSPSSYDILLSQNLVFLDLYDGSANNVIIECIVRNTPIVVKRHPAVVEYLGLEYPLYFTDIEEAAKIAEDFDRVNSAYLYLRNYPLRERLSATRFLEEFTQSIVYQTLPPSTAQLCGDFTLSEPMLTYN